MSALRSSATASQAIPSPRPVKPSFGGGRFHVDVVHMAAEILSDKDAHLRNMRQHFRRPGNNRDVDVAERIALGLNAAPCFAQQFAAIGAFKRRIGIGEQLADIAQRRGAKQRVGQRMQRDVAVGGASSPFS